MSQGVEAAHGLVKQRLFAAPRMLARLIREQADSFPAIGLAEGGDVEGAAELLARRAAKGA
ncbi:MAG: hypothetical protein PHY45_10520 [Rhodocyclaceae bacterium]|nr:hypothetical protein [Rhodocyclaceae bacterium]